MSEFAGKNTCPECGAPVKEKNGKYGPFIACTRYPDCNWSTGVDYWEACGEDPYEWYLSECEPNYNELVNG